MTERIYERIYIRCQVDLNRIEYIARHILWCNEFLIGINNSFIASLDTMKLSARLTDIKNCINKYLIITCDYKGFMVIGMPKAHKKILVVDDEENARIGLSRLLSREGFEVDSVSNGYEALNFMNSHDINLVVSDINMPEMNGISFLREMRKRHPETDVIMVTAYGGVDSYIESMNLGAFEYVNKPVKIDELKAILRKLFKEPANC